MNPPAAVAGPTRAKFDLPAAPPISQIAESVKYLEAAFGVDEQEAVRRLVVQREMPALTESLATRSADSYAGAWLDQEDGGRVVIAATRPADLTPRLATLPDWFQYRQTTARYSLRELQRLADLAGQSLGKAANITIDEIANQVVARLADPAALAAATSASATGQLAEAVRHNEIRVVAASTGGFDNQCLPGVCTPPRASGCDITNCTPPLRGGLNLDIWTEPTTSATFLGRCTAGFNISGSQGWLYTSTAGHCLDGSAYDTSNNGHWVGGWIGGSYWSGGGTYPNDHAVTPFVTGDDATYWLGAGPRNRVISGSDFSFPITGMYTYAQIGIGWVACATGTFTGTSCGSVLTKDGGIVMSGGGMCLHHGDSGAPLFSQVDNTGYGIHIKDTTNDDSCPSGYNASFTALSTFLGAQSDGVTLSLITG